jgi:hypothetical protein
MPTPRKSPLPPSSEDDPLLTPQEAAPIVRKTAKTLANWRLLRHPSRSIPFVRIGANVFYRRSALADFLATCERESQQ